MPSYQPAILREIINDKALRDEIKGEAIVSISRNDRGGMEASGTFKSQDKRLQPPEQLLSKLFQYEGPAFEGSKQLAITAVMFVKSSQGELYELEASTEPVIVQKL